MLGPRRTTRMLRRRLPSGRSRSTSRRRSPDSTRSRWTTWRRSPRLRLRRKNRSSSTCRRTARGLARRVTRRAWTRGVRGRCASACWRAVSAISAGCRRAARSRAPWRSRRSFHKPLTAVASSRRTSSVSRTTCARASAWPRGRTRMRAWAWRRRPAAKPSATRIWMPRRSSIRTAPPGPSPRCRQSCKRSSACSRRPTNTSRRPTRAPSTTPR